MSDQGLAGERILKRLTIWTRNGHAILDALAQPEVRDDLLSAIGMVRLRDNQGQVIGWQEPEA